MDNGQHYVPIIQVNKLKVFNLFNFMFGSFYDALNCSDYTASKHRKISE